MASRRFGPTATHRLKHVTATGFDGHADGEWPALELPSASAADDDGVTDQAGAFVATQAALAALVQYMYLGSLPPVSKRTLELVLEWSSAAVPLPRLASLCLFMLAPAPPRLPSQSAALLHSMEAFGAGTPQEIAAKVEARAAAWPALGESGQLETKPRTIVADSDAKRMALAVHATDQLLLTRPICCVDVSNRRVGVEQPLKISAEIEGSGPASGSGAAAAITTADQLSKDAGR